jgi:hypothetical protein
MDVIGIIPMILSILDITLSLKVFVTKVMDFMLQFCNKIVIHCFSFYQIKTFEISKHVVFIFIFLDLTANNNFCHVLSLNTKERKHIEQIENCCVLLFYSFSFVYICTQIFESCLCKFYGFYFYF